MLFTGQRRESSFGMYYYGARWYDPAVARFIQADTEIPQQQGVQAWDRYAYVNNNPVKYTDPSGKGVDCGMGDSSGCRQRVGKEQVGKVSNPIPVSTQSAMQTQANSPFTLATQLATPPGPFLGPAPTSTPSPSPTSTPIPIPQGQVAEAIDTAVNYAWNTANFAAGLYDTLAPNPSFAFARGAYVQAARDSGSGYSVPELVWRSVVSGAEGVVTDAASTFVGLSTGFAGAGGCAGLPGAGPALCGVGGYVAGAGATNVLINQLFNNANENYIFPLISELFSGG
jgi:RHS repeat-associated protein